MGIPEYEQEGFEADDAIATLVGQAEAFGFDTTILTGDLDMLQLVSEHTKLMVSLRGGIANTVAYDLAKIEERWGLRPDQMLDYKSLKGDPTDNIPGIPGVGEKTASKLIATWETLDALYAHIDEVAPEKLRLALEEHRESVLESRELMRLVRDVDVTLDPTRGRVGDYDRQEVVRLFREYEFRTLIDRLPPLIGERPEDAIAAMRELREAGFPAAQGVGRGAGGRGGARRSTRGRSSCRWTSTSSRAAAARRPRRWRRRHRHDVAGRRGARRGARGRVRRRCGRAGGRDRRPRPHRARGHGPRGDAGAMAARAGRRSASALVVDDPRPLAGTPLSLAVAGEDGRVVAADGAEASIALRHLLEAVGVPARRPRREAAAHREVRARTARPRRSTSRSTRRSRPTSSTPRSGPRRSPTSSRSASTSSCPRRPPASRRRRSPASRRCPRSPSGRRSTRRCGTTASTGCSRRSSCR